MTKDLVSQYDPAGEMEATVPAVYHHPLSSQYWETRAERFASTGNGLRAVCSFGMPWFYNRYIDLTQRLALKPWLRPAPNTTVLDVGCGIGRWSLALARSGAAVTGIDLSTSMLQEARHRALQQGMTGQCQFLHADLAEIALGQCFDRILGVTVLQHITDDDRFGAAVKNLAAHLAPGGRLVLLEASPSVADTRCNSTTFRARDTACFLDAFGRAGLTCLAIHGVDPTPLKTLYLPWYSRLPRLVALLGLFLVTTFSLPADLIAGRRLRRASWHKVFVLMKTEV